MAENIEITNNTTRSIEIWEPVYQKDVIAFPGADTYAAGTILARKLVEDAVVVAAGTNTGNGTITLATVAGNEVPKVGAYAFTMTAALVGSLIDPDGIVVASNIAIADGAAIVLNLGGLEFTVTDGGTAFVATDTFSLTVAADGDLVVYAKDGTGGAQTPKAILTYEEIQTGAADVSARVLISGRVRQGDLIIDADGDASNIDAAVVDQLRDFTIIPQTTTQLAELDNS